MNTDLRVGDAERDEVTAALHEHFAQGRLTRDELDERLTATLSAKTVGDLRAVTRDLPGPGPAQDSAGHGPWEPGAAHWGRGPLIPARRGWARGDMAHRGAMAHRGGWADRDVAWRRRGWGPPRHRPFGLLLFVPIVVAAVTGWWVIFPVLFCVWFAAAFTVLRYARRRFPIAPRR